MVVRPFYLCFTVLLFSAFLFSVFQRSAVPRVGVVYADRVVMPAPLLLLLAGGDRYLAGNVEVVRLAATSIDSGRVDMLYLSRAQREVARLHPCHEDNYYLANGLLTWGGAVEQGNAVLQAAMDCRFWDGVPAFFYGVNREFFDHDTDDAVRALELSAQRWPENSAVLRKFAVMLRVDSFADETLAMEYLRQQRDSTKDLKLRAMLDKRVERLQGLIELRTAQRRYESVRGRLQSLEQLISSGELQQLPSDPLRLGYELRNGRIELKRAKIAGMESRP